MPAEVDRLNHGIGQPRARIGIDLGALDAVVGAVATAVLDRVGGVGVEQRQDGGWTARWRSCTRRRRAAEAPEHKRAGRFAEARGVLAATERRIREYAGDDPELNHIADRLRQDQSLYDERMSLRAMKQQHFAAYSVTHRRATARRGRPLCLPYLLATLVAAVVAATAIGAKAKAQQIPNKFRAGTTAAVLDVLRVEGLGLRWKSRLFSRW